MKKVYYLLALGLIITQMVQSQSYTKGISVLDETKYELIQLTDDGVSVEMMNDNRNKTKWFSSDKAVVFNGKYYFTGSTADAGKELWLTDGTQAGTMMVKDINPGSGGSNPDALMVAGPKGNEKLYFAADDGEHGIELWVSDGTAAGTNMVADLFVKDPEDVEDIVTPADTICFDPVIDKIDTTYKYATTYDTIAIGETPSCDFTLFTDTVKNVSGEDSLVYVKCVDSTNFTMVYDTTLATVQLVEWAPAETVILQYKGGDFSLVPDTFIVPPSNGKRRYKTGYCHVKPGSVVEQSGNGSSFPFALSKFGDDLLFTALYEDEGGYSSQGLRWLWKYDIGEEQVVFVSDEVQPYPFRRQHDAMRWNYAQPFQIIDIGGTPVALFMGRHKKYGDELCYTDGIAKADGGKTGVVLDFTDTPDPSNPIDGATKGSATLDWIQKVHPNWVIFRNSTLGKWAGSPLTELDQNPWASNGYQTFLLEDMNQNTAGAGTRTSPSYLGDYFMFKGALYCAGQAGNINKQIYKFTDVKPQSHEVWYMNGPADDGTYDNCRFAKAGYFKNPHNNLEYMFFSSRVEKVRTQPWTINADTSKFNANLGEALFYTQGTYDDVVIADSLSRSYKHNAASTEQITQFKDKLYVSEYDQNDKTTLFCFAFAEGTEYEEDTYFQVADFQGGKNGNGGPQQLRALDNALVMMSKEQKALYALVEKNPTWEGPTPVYNPDDQLMGEINPPMWDGTWDYGFGDVVDLKNLQSDEVKNAFIPNTSVKAKEVFDIKAITKLYPNPASNVINVEIEGDFTPVRYSIINMNGQVVLTGKYTSSQIDVSSLIGGQYSLGLLTKDKQILVKVFLKM